MLTASKRPSHAVDSFSAENGAALFHSAYGKTRITSVGSGILRVTVTLKPEFSEAVPDFIVCNSLHPVTITEENGSYRVSADGISCRISGEDGTLSFFDADGKLLTNEKAPCEIEKFDAFMISRDKPIEQITVNTPDGVKNFAVNASRDYYKSLYHMRLSLDFKLGEALYGLGQAEYGKLNLRNRTLWNCQHNRAIALPFMVSTRGYGLLLSTGSPFKFVDGENGGYFYIEAGEELDYYVISGGMEQAVKGYRFLTGKAVLPPRWAFGYIQSQEAYETSEEILSIAKGCRERGIGIDCVVQDWNSWEPGKWGNKRVDKKRFPDLRKLTDDLHGMHAHMMLSIWPNMAKESENGKEFAEKNLLLAGSDTYDALDPEARRLYWKQADEGLFSQGLDAWWCDSAETWTPEWNYINEPEESAVYYQYLSMAGEVIPPEKANMYPFYHGTAMSEGQRATGTGKRVCNLTRSAWAGQQRLGCIMWSGDISATWKTLKDQIAQGMNFCASGIPYWTLDIGGFFVKRAAQFFWNGSFDKGWDDPEFCELYVRWFQYAAFLPVFRAHGTDFRREMWNLHGENYDAVVKANRDRYRLLPYIYSLAGDAYLNDTIMMKPVAFCFPEDEKTYELNDQFMLGDSLMVCPVTDYGARSRKVYLPAGIWYDRNTGKKYEGGREIEAPAPLSDIPVFVRAGSIIPEFEPALSTEEAFADNRLTLRTYPGADGHFTLYSDAGDGYGYLNGEYTLTEYRWDNQSGKII